MRTHTTRRARRRQPAALVITLALAAGCGGSDESNSQNQDDTTSSTSIATTTLPEDDGSTPTTATTPSPSTTTEPPPTSTPPPTSVDPDGWDDIAGWSGTEFGRVRALFFEPEFAWDAPDGSTLLCPPGTRHSGIAVHEGASERSPSPPASHPAGLLALRLGEATLDDTVAAIIAGVDDPTTPTETSIGDITGVTLDGDAPQEATVLYNSAVGDCTAKFDLGQKWRFWVVEVGNSPVTFAAYAASDQFLDHIADLEAVVQSVEWRPPTD